MVAVWLDFMVAGFRGSVVVCCVGGDLCGGFWLIWIFGSGYGWLFLAC